MKATLIFVFLIAIGWNSSQNIYAQSTVAYLEKVSNNIAQYQSFKYNNRSSISAPGDTAVFRSFESHVFEFTNKSDTAIGAGYVVRNATDTSKVEFIYDGYKAAHLNWEEGIVDLDDFENSSKDEPRLIAPPFFKNINGIIRYSIESKDSIGLVQYDFNDSIKITLRVYDKLVQFNGKPIVIDRAGEISQYDIWIDKKTDLPFRLRRKLSHQTTFEYCSNITTSKVISEPTKADLYFPPGFIISNSRKKNYSPKELIDTKAPDWSLLDASGKEVIFKNLDSKVLLLQFTGVGCGPCHLSIEFLKDFVDENKNKDFELISIESWSKNVSGLKRYQEMNELNYKFLLSNKEMLEQYKTSGVPVFFVLNEDREVKNVIVGYIKGRTDDEIREAVNLQL